MRAVLVFLFLVFSLSASSQSNICFKRLHSGYAEVLIPMSQWNDTTITLKVHRPNSSLVANPVTYNTDDITRVTNNGQQYYYIKGFNNAYGDETLTYEVSSPLDTAVSNTLTPLPQDQWNTAGTADVCGVPKADICFKRLHGGFAEVLVPVAQWNSSTISVRSIEGQYATAYTTYNTGDLTLVTAADGANYYYIKYQTVNLTNAFILEVSGPQDAAVSNTLAPLPQDQWNTAGTADVCGVPKADICFNRLHLGIIEVYIPVNQWNGDTVKIKGYDMNGYGPAIGETIYATGSLPQLTGTDGTIYYYITAPNHYALTGLTVEVGSREDATVSYTLGDLPVSQLNTAGTADACGVAKADICFNRVHGGFAEVLIPVNQWHGNNITVRGLHTPTGYGAFMFTYNTNDVTKVITNGTEYYYLKVGNLYNIDLVVEVSSPENAAVSYHLPVLPESEWNNFALQESCINKANGLCVNRNNTNFTVHVPVNQWNGNKVNVRLYRSSGQLLLDYPFNNPGTEINNGVFSYKITFSYPHYSNEKLVVDVYSDTNAAVHMYLDSVQQLCFENGSCATPVTPAFTQVEPVCKGAAFILPAASNNNITGTWSPSINTSATTTYTFVPDTGQCANSTMMIVEVKAGLAWVSGDTIQTLNVYTPLTSIVYTLGDSATGTTVTGLPAGVASAVNGSTLTISGIPAVAGTFSYTVFTTTACGADSAKGTITVNAAVVDWTLAPNSYIFTGKDTGNNNVDGLYIPVKKAYAMWGNGKYMKDTSMIPAGPITADVLWEDNMGLIKSKENYALDIIGTGEDAKIKVPVNKVKEGNAVIAYKINGEVFWSWHVWVTDDPTNGSTYKSYDDVKRELSNGTIETIPDAEWGWMDRNLGAIGHTLNGDGWNRNGGLMYQWGRKDPFPSLSDGTAFYQVTGSLGKIAYEGAMGRLKFVNSPFNDYKSLIDLRKYVKKSEARITDNIRLSVKNPLSLIYVTNDGTTTPSTYGIVDSVAYYYNWFGQVPGLQTSELSKTNLWSDNSLGIQATNITVPKPYRNKSSYDPCPNGWRLPSVLVASATKDVRMDFTPFGPKTSSPLSALNLPGSNVPPGSSIRADIAGIKVYPQVGFDMTNVGGHNIGIFPGTGWIGRGLPTNQDGRYHSETTTHTDQLETYLWTATMTSLGGYASIASALR